MSVVGDGVAIGQQTGSTVDARSEQLMQFSLDMRLAYRALISM